MIALAEEMLDGLDAMHEGAIGERVRERPIAECGEGSRWSRMEGLRGTEACPDHGLPDGVAYVDCGSCDIGECWPWGTTPLEEVCSELWPDAARAIHGVALPSPGGEGRLGVPF